MKKMTKQERQEWVNNLLSSRGVPEYGRASKVAKEVPCSHAKATSWLIGQLPKDTELAARFCRTFNTTVEEWVTGEPQTSVSADHSLYETAVTQTLAFQEKNGRLNDDTFIIVFNMMVKDARGTFDLTEDTMLLVNSITNTGKEEDKQNGGWKE